MSGSTLLGAMMAGAATAARERSARHRTVVERQASERRPLGTFRDSLRAGGPRVIAECKRRSPSRGVLRADYDPAGIAAAYQAAGAAAISVLTDAGFFDGALTHLAAVRERVALPILRKDFISDPFQLLEARAAGADAVLLIVAGLDDEQLRHLLREAAHLELEVLVEVHDRVELQRALGLGASIVGVNSRNLKTLEVHLDLHEALVLGLPADVVTVAESGLRSGADLVRLSRAGYDAFLVGERFMTLDDPGAGLTAMLSEARV